MDDRALLVLDFDGVICDSLPECFVSSWFAYHELLNRRMPDSVEREALKRFSSLRPYIRSGEDYLLIQDLLSRRRDVASQAEFDALVSQAGAPLMGRYKALLYEARERLLAEAPDYWCRLNVIYPHMRGGMGRLGPAADVYILSTKRAPFIMRILGANGIEFPEPHVLYTASRPKAGVILELLESTGAPGALFVDDQIDHFAGSRSWPRERPIECYLASWGYVRAEWLREPKDCSVLRPEEARNLMEPYLR